MEKILVVDDEAICTRYLALALQDAGYTVKTSSTAEDALEISQEFAPHTLVSDWKLGGTLDGIQLARQLQEKNPELRVILFSGLPADELISKLDQVTVLGVLQKPCSVEDMLPLLK